MRAELGPLAVTTGFLAVGLGVIDALGVLDRSLRGILAALGLAYLTGVSAVCVALIALLTVKVPFTFASFVVACFVLAGSTAAVGIRRRPIRRTGERLPVRSYLPDLRSVKVAVPFALLAILFVYLLIGLAQAAVQPLDGFDAFAIWTHKAVLLTNGDQLPLQALTNSGTAPYLHADYPLLLPVFEAAHFRAAGTIDTQLLHAELWLLLIAFAWAVAFVVRRSTPLWLSAPVVVVAAVAPGVRAHLLSGYADVPMGLFIATGALLLGRWISGSGRVELGLAALMLAAGANVKNEGLTVAVALLMVAAIVVAVRGERRRLAAVGLASAGVIAGALPWRIWIAAHHISTEYPLSRSFSPRYLLDHVGRVTPALDGLHSQLANESTWLLILPLAIALGVACVFAGVAQRAAAFYLGGGAAIFAVLVWAYWISPLEIHEHVGSSADRVVVGLMLVAAAAVLQLGGHLAAASGLEDTVATSVSAKR
ncbi:MAG: hypothetical protein M3Z54_14535 [Gemmatimonadota bacterium]|nr:hypothetical protein [Gemmatimonadota bacterium]